MLGAALALSLLFHLVVAPFVRPPADAVPYHAIPVITHIWIRPTPQPPKPPQHLRTPISHQLIPDVSLPAARPHDSRKPNGHVAITPSVPTGEPNAPGNPGTNGPGGVIGQPAVPTGAPGPACSDPNVEAKTIDAISPDQTASGFAADTNVTAMIKVDLDASGSVTGVSVYASTGSMELDRAALQAARESTYAPEMRDCQAVPGSYLFRVEFSS
ncbi:MAG TPA: energy transducer TonB [Candidatus Rubrimentiphilum sp.]|nr:energy transducer TonB [Candidatus Rubrimentiphilum sp.]